MSGDIAHEAYIVMIISVVKSTIEAITVHIAPTAMNRTPLGVHRKIQYNRCLRSVVARIGFEWTAMGSGFRV